MLHVRHAIYPGRQGCAVARGAVLRCTYPAWGGSADEIGRYGASSERVRAHHPGGAKALDPVL